MRDAQQRALKQHCLESPDSVESKIHLDSLTLITEWAAIGYDQNADRNVDKLHPDEVLDGKQEVLELE